jgi:hypothetical protein
MILKTFKSTKRSFFKNDFTSQYGIASITLFTYMSFRLNKKDTNDYFVFIRNLKRVFFSCFKKTNYTHTNSNSKILFLNSTNSNINKRIVHAEKLINNKINVIVTRDDLLAFFNFKLYVKNIYLAVYVFFIVIFNKKRYPSRQNIALLIRELPELNSLIFIIKKHQIKQVLDYGCYEVDSNFLYLLLKQLNVEVVKIPPPGPLFAHLKHLLTDELVISSQYHLEEILEFRNTIKYSKLKHFYPEFYDFSRIESQKSKIDNSNVFGFYSHASWLREKNNDSDNGLNLLNAEEYLLDLINKVFSYHKNYKIIIFLHPKERKDLKTTQNYYNKILKDISFEFSPSNMSSSDCFELCNIALVSLSTILFERLFAGYKIFICNKHISNFPLSKSVLNSISFETEQELIKLINFNIYISDNEFFNKHHLNSYLVNNFVAK